MFDHVVLDVEIQKTVEELPHGWDDTHLMGVAVACVWEYRTRRMRVYGPEDVEALRERLLKADRITGYNIWNFDFPVIWGIGKRAWMGYEGTIEKYGWSLKSFLIVKTNDILRRIWVAQGFDPDVWQAGMGGCKLDDVARHTLGMKKIGNGMDAPRWYQAGQIQRVVNYCADDVALERDLSDFVDRYGYVLTGAGKRLELAAWEGK